MDEFFEGLGALAGVGAEVAVTTAEVVEVGAEVVAEVAADDLGDGDNGRNGDNARNDDNAAPRQTSIQGANARNGDNARNNDDIPNRKVNTNSNTGGCMGAVEAWGWEIFSIFAAVVWCYWCYHAHHPDHFVTGPVVIGCVYLWREATLIVPCVLFWFGLWCTVAYFGNRFAGGKELDATYDSTYMNKKIEDLLGLEQEANAHWQLSLSAAIFFFGSIMCMRGTISPTVPCVNGESIIRNDFWRSCMRLFVVAAAALGTASFYPGDADMALRSALLVILVPDLCSVVGWYWNSFCSNRFGCCILISIGSVAIYALLSWYSGTDVETLCNDDVETLYNDAETVSNFLQSASKIYNDDAEAVSNFSHKLSQVLLPSN